MGDDAQDRDLCRMCHIFFRSDTVIQERSQESQCDPQDQPEDQPDQYDELFLGFDREFRQERSVDDTVLTDRRCLQDGRSERFSSR